MLSSFTSMEESKVVMFVKSFVTSVSIFKEGVKFEAGKEIVSDSADMVEKESDLAALRKELKEVIGDLGLEDEIGFSYSKEGLVIRLPDVILFKIGEAEVSPKAAPLLNKIAAIILRTTHLIRIEGHTDNIQIHTREFPSNWELSTSRAVNVLRYFTEVAKITSNRFSIVGYGEFHPIVPNDSPVNRSINRRVGIVFVDQPQS
jgi:chemotaxis protein MotB